MSIYGQGDLAVVGRRRTEERRDRNITIRRTDMEFITDPRLFITLTIFLASDITGFRDFRPHFFQRLVLLLF